MTDLREVIPAGMQRFWDHMIPIAKFFIDRGHHPLDTEGDENSFQGWMGSIRCELAYDITDDGWILLNERFVIPQNIGYFQGMIRDNVNRIDIVGVSEVLDAEEGVMSIDAWMERERRDSES